MLPVIRFPAPQISPRDEEGFSSCLMRPCHRAVANAPPERPAASISLRRSMLPSPPNRGFGLWIRILEVTYAFTFVTARRLAHHPMDGFVDPLHALRFLRACDPGYRALTFTLVGLPPTEHISLLLDMRLGIPLPAKGVCSSNHGRSFDRRDVWGGCPSCAPKNPHGKGDLCQERPRCGAQHHVTNSRRSVTDSKKNDLFPETKRSCS